MFDVYKTKQTRNWEAGFFLTSSLFVWTLSNNYRRSPGTKHHRAAVVFFQSSITPVRKNPHCSYCLLVHFTYFLKSWIEGRKRKENFLMNSYFLVCVKAWGDAGEHPVWHLTSHVTLWRVATHTQESPHVSALRPQQDCTSQSPQVTDPNPILTGFLRESSSYTIVMRIEWPDMDICKGPTLAILFIIQLMGHLYYVLSLRYVPRPFVDKASTSAILFLLVWDAADTQ